MSHERRVRARSRGGYHSAARTRCPSRGGSGALIEDPRLTRQRPVQRYQLREPASARTEDSELLTDDRQPQLRHVVALDQHGGHGSLRPGFDLGKPLRLRGYLRAGVVDERDRLGVAALHGTHVVEAIEQIVESVRVDDHVHQRRGWGLVLGDQLGRPASRGHRGPSIVVAAKPEAVRDQDAAVLALSAAVMR